MLHDVSKDSDSRSIPIPNVDDSLSQRMAHGTTQVQHNAEGTSFDTRLAVQERRIIGVKNGVNKALFGFNDNAEFFFKIAPDGVDVLTASDSELYLNSANNTFKIVEVPTIEHTIAFGASGGTSFKSFEPTIPFSSFIPFILPPSSVSTAYQSVPYITTTTYNLPPQVIAISTIAKVTILSDGTFSLNIEGNSNGENGTYTWKLYLLQETVN